MITTAAVRNPDFALASRGVVVVSGRKKKMNWRKGSSLKLRQPDRHHVMEWIRATSA